MLAKPLFGNVRCVDSAPFALGAVTISLILRHRSEMILCTTAVPAALDAAEILVGGWFVLNRALIWRWDEGLFKSFKAGCGNSLKNGGSVVAPGAHVRGAARETSPWWPFALALPFQCQPRFFSTTFVHLV